MSPMRNQPSNQRGITVLLLVMMFIFADMALPQTLEGWTLLEDEQEPSRTVSTHSVLADTYITVADPTGTYNGSTTGSLNDDLISESKLLFRFPMNFTSSDTIHSATLDLNCTTDAEIGSTEMIAYAAEMKRTWNGSYASWMIYASSLSWDVAGADGDADRGIWEPPVRLSSNGTLSLNVTAIAQDAALSNQAHVSIIVTSLGAAYDCSMSEATNAASRPSLLIDSSATAAGSGQTVQTDLPIAEGAPWMESAFLLAPVTTPDISYANNTGAEVEIQLSHSDDFRSMSDDLWHFSTLWNTFGSTGTSGHYAIPSSLALTNGSDMYMRVRSLDSSGQIGTWDNTHFLLPSLDVTDNGDGTATMTLEPTDLGLASNFFQDATVSETSKTTKYGGEATFEASMTSSKERISHLRASLNQLGLHDNLTIVDASLNLTRFGHTGDPVVSLHGMDDSGLWVEGDITWNQMSTNGIQWYDGGRGNGTAAFGLADGNRSLDLFSFDITHPVQNYLDGGDDDPLDMLLAVRGKYESHTNGEGIVFHAAEGNGDLPVFSLTYEWGSGVTPNAVSLTAPTDGLAIWNQTGHNLSGNTQPSLNWSLPSSGDDIVFEMATDEDFRLRTMRVDTRIDNDFSPVDGTLAMTGAKTLDLGNMYFWRMATVDADGHYGTWVSSSFLISNLESEWLGGDRYEFRMKHGNGTDDNQYPECMDTYIDSGDTNGNYNGDEEMAIDYNTLPSETTVLLGCNLVSNLLPSGYAVESAQLHMTLTSSTFGNPTIAVWENLQNNWSDGDATWASYDGDNSWATGGAKGAERGSLLDSESIGSSYSEGDVVEWNVTLAVQNAMREDRRVDFIAGMLAIGSGSSRTAYFSSAEGSMSDRPELTFVYVPGSDAVPSNPTLNLPLNGSWSIGTGVDMTPIAQPELDWSFSGTMTIGGYLLQLDTQSDFSSVASMTYASWNDPGFDLTNFSFTPSSDLDDGNTWYWRVRAVSATNQIGNWSSTYHFHLPNLTTHVVDATKASVELHHREALPHMNLPNFIDTYVMEGGQGASSTNENSTGLLVGETSSGHQSAALIKLPLSEIPQPANARVTQAEINLFAEYGSAVGEPVAVRQVLQNWTTSANNTTYDGVNNWSLPGGRNIGVDIGGYVDLVSSVDDSWMTFDVTEAVQAAIANGETHVSLMIYTSSETTDDIVFTSTEGSSTEHPWMNLTWEDGAGTTPTLAATNIGPVSNSIVWDSTSHALLADDQPTFSWTYGSTTAADHWRVFILADANNDMAGLYTYDSRTNGSAFDITNMTFTPPAPLVYSREIRWMVQAVNDGMLGPRSNSTHFHLPSTVATEINSTDATLSVQEGAIVPVLNYPTSTQDTFLDSGNTQSNEGNGYSLYVGRSATAYNNVNLRSSSLISVDFSMLPMPATYEVVDATLELDVLNRNGQVLMSVSDMVSSWTESSTWAYPAGNNSSWSGTGAYHTSDSNAPFNPGFWVNSSDTVAANVTALVQHALANGQSGIDVILQAEEYNGAVNGRIEFASSEYPLLDLRPRLNMTYRLITPHVPSASTGLLPADGATLWDTSQPRPSGQDMSEFTWSATVNNETRWIACAADDERMTQEVECYDLNAIMDGAETNITYDPVNMTISVSNMSKGDSWVYWRVRADQDHRIGEWSAVHSYRNPSNYGSDDGNGNHTLELYRESIFSVTGSIPSVPDVEIDSSTNVNTGSSASLDLGQSSGGSGESRILMEFDLTNLPWPAAMTPTSMVLQMYRTSLQGTSSTTVSAHACSSFNEGSTIWATAPSCSTTEITRTTLTLLPPDGWMEWDLTSLAQDNIANGNTTMTIMLQRVGTSSTTHSFHSSDVTNESLRPRIVLDYVDNVAGIIPPAQPSLITPTDGEVLYEELSGLLVPELQPLLSWNPVTGATGYIVSIANESGVTKYRSWEDSEITNTTFRFSDNLSQSDVYSWWVQGVNQSIPGPSSARWSFAVGSPNHVFNSDLTYTYTFQTGNEIVQYGHTNIQDTAIYSEYGAQNYVDDDVMSVGEFCGTLWTDECRATLGLDASQVPFAPYQQVHSASLGLFIEDWVSVGQATSMTFSIHEVTSSAWSQTSVTWNGTTSGSQWGAPGMQAGVDYAATPLSQVVLNVDTTGWVWFDISTEGMTLSSSTKWIILGTSNVGHAHASFYTSEAGDQNYRPQILFNTTNVSTIDLSPSGTPTTDADTNVLFQYAAYDHLSMVQSPPVVWKASAGSIGSNGLFTPSMSGTITISACFGLVCGSQNITVTPGAPTDLIVSPLTATITADQTLLITANMVDQHGNIVPGQPLTFTPSNGSMSATMPNEFLPHAAGSHTIRVTHAITGGSFVDVGVTVLTGTPDYFELTGCSGTVPAGEWCDITTKLFDQFGNELNLSEAGNLTWTTTNGNYSEINQQYFPDHVGQWWLNLTSVYGVSSELLITVGHGEMAMLELNVSSTEITADERVYVNTTRVDVRGNRIAVVLPAENWTKIADGQLTPGAPAIWDPISRGAKTLEARYESTLAQVIITVSEGEIQALILIVDNEDAALSNSQFDLTADESLEVKVKAIDAKGNRWVVVADWTLDHPTMGDSSSFLEKVVGDSTVFMPYLASEDEYVLTATYDDGTIIHQVSLESLISHGFLHTVSISGVVNNPLSTNGASFDMTSDYAVDFSAELSDMDGNRIDVSQLTWLLIEDESGVATDITTDLLMSGMRWEAGSIGEYSIQAYSISGTGYNITDSIAITVYHGIAVSVNSNLIAGSSSTTPVAGDLIEIYINGTDADGNIFAQNVQWAENGSEVTTLTAVEATDGAYVYAAEIAGIHTLFFEAGDASSSLELNISAQSIVNRLEVNLSATGVEQLGTVQISIRAFDVFNNEIPVPSSIQVDATGRASVTMQTSDSWTITTLEDGAQTITVNVGAVRVDSDIEVTGTLAGFFESGGTLYYVGAGLLALVGLVLVGLLVNFMRSGSDDWDDEYEEKYEDESVGVSSGPAAGPSGPAPGQSGPASGPSGPAPGPSGPASGPSGPAPGPSGPAPVSEPEPVEEPSAIEDDESYRVDDEGTEWWEEDEGTWWYRVQGAEEWDEWTE